MATMDDLVYFLGGLADYKTAQDKLAYEKEQDKNKLIAELTAKGYQQYEPTYTPQKMGTMPELGSKSPLTGFLSTGELEMPKPNQMPLGTAKVGGLGYFAPGPSIKKYETTQDIWNQMPDEEKAAFLERGGSIKGTTGGYTIKGKPSSGVKPGQNAPITEADRIEELAIKDAGGMSQWASKPQAIKAAYRKAAKEKRAGKIASVEQRPLPKSFIGANGMPTNPKTGQPLQKGDVLNDKGVKYMWPGGRATYVIKVDE